MRKIKVESWVGTVHLAVSGEVFLRDGKDSILRGSAYCGERAMFFLKKPAAAPVTCKRCLKKAEADRKANGRS